MGTSIFTWKLQYLTPEEGFLPAHQDRASVAGPLRRRRIDASRWVVPSAMAIFTDATSGESLADFDTWFRTTLVDGLHSFLLKPNRASAYIIEGEDNGDVASGGAGEDFFLASKFIDSSTLVVKAGGSTQDPGDYTFSLNNTTPKITTGAGFGAGAVTFNYERYFQLRLMNPSTVSRLLTRATSLTLPGACAIPISMQEVRAGGHLA